MVGSSRSYTRDVVGDLWTALEAGGMPSHRQRAALAGAVSHVCHSCHEAVQLLADTVGSSSIYTRNPLERRLRDLTTLRQHVIAQPKILEVVGGLWLDGADLHNPLLSLRII
jgi:alkylation response protein AidB-like acyl-CoA dehydrogenase